MDEILPNILFKKIAMHIYDRQSWYEFALLNTYTYKIIDELSPEKRILVEFQNWPAIPFDDFDPTNRLNIFASTYNVLRIMAGMGCLQYQN